MTGRRLRIGFLSRADARSRSPQSGVFFFMAKALQKHCGDVVFLGPYTPVPSDPPAPTEPPAADPDSAGKKYDTERNRTVSQALARFFEERLRQEKVNLIFAPNAAPEIAYLETDLPIIYLSDATVRLLDGYYENFTHLANRDEVDDIERRAIQKAQLLIYRSPWAAESAVRDYAAAPERVHAIPNGANIDDPPPAADEVLGRKQGLACRLLFLGVDWNRKGGDIAYRTLEQLNEAGVRSELIVCGCQPTLPSVKEDPRVTIIPFLHKDQPDHRQLMANLFRAADFLLLPTRADCFLNAASEASAYGIPSIVTDTGGVSAAVENGKNGYLLPLEAGADDYASLIAEIYRDGERYARLARSSRTLFETRLNWDTWALTLRELLERNIPADLNAAL